ncbi:hypothetical protein [Vibrio fluvialis]|uniref:hypothetical protein n=1 Tax=Vibrio fluvialis TaxID=676 RepID=UPI0023A9942F|nr:hypothetical protein [Vibrio fluvialis]MDE5178995.1 hypothetical protein [Vibrio fluvialis]
MTERKLVSELPKNDYSIFMLKTRGGKSVSELCTMHQIADLPDTATIEAVSRLDHANPDKVCEIYCHSEDIPYLYDISALAVHPKISESHTIKRWCEKTQVLIAEHNGNLLFLSCNYENIRHSDTLVNEFFKKTNTSGHAVAMGCSAKHLNAMLDGIGLHDAYTVEASDESPLGKLLKKAFSLEVRSVWVTKETGRAVLFQHEKSFSDGRTAENAVPQLEDILMEKSTNNRYQVAIEEHVYQLEIHDFIDTIMIVVHYELSDSNTSSANLTYPIKAPLEKYRDAVNKALKNETPLILCVSKNACVHLIASEMAKTAIAFLKNNAANILINTGYYRYDDKTLVPLNCSLAKIEKTAHLNPLALLMGACLTKEELGTIKSYIEHLTPAFAVTNCKELMLPTELRPYAVSIDIGEYTL